MPSARRLAALARHLQPPAASSALPARDPQSLASSLFAEHNTSASRKPLSSVPVVAAAVDEPMAEMSEREKFLLDMHGFLVVPDVLTMDEVGALNASFDANWV